MSPISQACRRAACARPRLPFLGVCCRTLEKHGVCGTGRVVYRVEDLQAWVNDAAKTSTSDPGKVIVPPAKRHMAAALEQARQPRR